MKASDLIANLKNLIDTYGDLELIYAHDDEGNGFSSIGYEPTVYDCNFGEFYTEEEAIEYGEEFTPSFICVN